MTHEWERALWMLEFIAKREITKQQTITWEEIRETIETNTHVYSTTEVKRRNFQNSPRGIAVWRSSRTSMAFIVIHFSSRVPITFQYMYEFNRFRQVYECYFTHTRNLKGWEDISSQNKTELPLHMITRNRKPFGFGLIGLALSKANKLRPKQLSLYWFKEFSNLNRMTPNWSLNQLVRLKPS